MNSKNIEVKLHLKNSSIQKWEYENIEFEIIQFDVDQKSIRPSQLFFTTWLTCNLLQNRTKQPWVLGGQKIKTSTAQE